MKKEEVVVEVLKDEVTNDIEEIKLENSNTETATDKVINIDEEKVLIHMTCLN